jgi:hypothetical protein
VGATGRFRVRIRRDIGRAVREQAEPLDGGVFSFSYGWRMTDSDPYPGEIAWVFVERPAHWRGVPAWIASGDLEEA